MLAFRKFQKLALSCWGPTGELVNSRQQATGNQTLYCQYNRPTRNTSQQYKLQTTIPFGRAPAADWLNWRSASSYTQHRTHARTHTQLLAAASSVAKVKARSHNAFIRRPAHQIFLIFVPPPPYEQGLTNRNVLSHVSDIKSINLIILNYGTT